VFKTEEIVGDVVLIDMREERYVTLGITGTSHHFLVQGFDNIGIWVKHPGLISITKKDKNGKLLPPDKHIKEEIDANFVITWDNINSVMHYPNRRGFDFPSEFDKDFGFIHKDDDNA